jgi:hypothetical protein
VDIYNQSPELARRRESYRWGCSSVLDKKAGLSLGYSSSWSFGLYWRHLGWVYIAGSWRENCAVMLYVRRVAMDDMWRMQCLVRQERCGWHNIRSKPQIRFQCPFTQGTAYFKKSTFLLHARLILSSSSFRGGLQENNFWKKYILGYIYPSLSRPVSLRHIQLAVLRTAREVGKASYI